MNSPDTIIKQASAAKPTTRLDNLLSQIEEHRQNVIDATSCVRRAADQLLGAEAETDPRSPGPDQLSNGEESFVHRFEVAAARLEGTVHGLLRQAHRLEEGGIVN